MRKVILIIVVAVTAFADECNLDEETCFPYSDNQFSGLLSRYSEQEKLDAINNYARKQKIFVKDVDFRITKDKGIGLFTRKPIKKGETILRISLDKVFSSTDYDTIFKQNKGVPYLSFSGKEVPKIATYEPYNYRFMLLLHYHLANLEKSEYFEDLIGMPANITNPKIVLPAELVNTLEANMKTQINNFRARTKKAFKVYRTFIERSWSPEIIRKMLGEYKLSFSNFIFCFFIQHSRSSPARIETGTEVALIPTYHYINTPSVFLKEYHTESLAFEYPNQIINTAMKDFEPEEEVTHMYGKFMNHQNFLIYDYVPEKNDWHCEEIEDKALQSSLMEFMPQESCLKKHTIVKLFNEINMRNLNEEDQNQCQKLVKNAKTDDLEKYRFESCPKVTFVHSRKLWENLKSLYEKRAGIWQAALKTWNSALSRFTAQHDNKAIEFLSENIKKLFSKNAEFADSIVEEMNLIERQAWGLAQNEDL